MAGDNPAHSLITANLIRHIGSALDGTPCATYPSDLKVRSSPTQYVNPDTTVICGEVETDDADPRTTMIAPSNGCAASSCRR